MQDENYKKKLARGVDGGGMVGNRSRDPVEI